MFGKIIEAVKVMLSAALFLGTVGGCVYGIGKNVAEALAHRNEPVYLVSRAQDPFWRKAGFVPADIVCYSPARCEPNGKPSPQYLVLLKEYEVRQWGLDPANEIPVEDDPYL